MNSLGRRKDPGPVTAGCKDHPRPKEPRERAVPGCQIGKHHHFKTQASSREVERLSSPTSDVHLSLLLAEPHGKTAKEPSAGVGSASQAELERRAQWLWGHMEDVHGGPQRLDSSLSPSSRPSPHPGAQRLLSDPSWVCLEQSFSSAPHKQESRLPRGVVQVKTLSPLPGALAPGGFWACL